MRKTKILCTLGPATESPEIIAELIAKGADVMRLNMSHASHDWVRMVYARVREAAAASKREIAVLMDLTGPSIRTGDVEQPWQLQVGDTVEFRCKPDAVPTTAYSVTVNYPELGKDLKAGDIIMVDGGMIQIKATEVTARHVVGTVLTKGEMKSRRHINLPGIPVRLPPLTQKDYADLDLGVELGADYFALSFAREPGHIQHLQLLLEQKNSKARVIAKIENKQALDNIDALVESSGGIMIARGDLGSEMPIEDLPLIQRQIVERCSYHGRKVIVATQMLESMIENPVPTRAEVTDIFNAVIEQVDCVMLSGETSVGRYATKCVEVLDTVISRIEQNYPSGRFASDAPLKTNKHKTVKAAIALANSIEGSKLLVFTIRGVMAHLLAHQRPEFAPIFAFTPNLHVSRTLVTARGVHPFVLSFEEGNPERSIRDALDILRRENLIKTGDPLVILSDALYDGVNVDAILLREA
jgi:pyruvate kinase